ncbi:alkyl hydroperoxide reductase/ Thiol specific antioxidant/ Mal allergen [Caldithrix abyssi DSM 13497]|uniref:Alkyl hydroperoxide reductase/ Thiol specific antioxidant/ Mal allergen n=1 Tax=Caldithrix abyssi DSM 13497 TaxID=880073 RepID=H1XXS5_CALAY|nr:thioredoxin-like domain-containing protein [Caldithrix abyssi]APF19627.1 Thiol-disulfide isomerase or thioredoxin [Caldithrix abyssi DSM 13497]EHO39748.1 alkyl hydroperoxide reductase/ Thiol specific antioxidant/ Mal allergen [Caldithrix abyssi DSM 13497]
MFKFFNYLLVVMMLAVLWNCSGNSGGKLSGKIIGANGEPLAIAHIHVAEAGGNVFKPLKSVQTNEDGTFTIDLPRAQYLSILVTAPYHEPLELPLARSNDHQSLEIDFQLQGHQYLPEFNRVKITGDWIDFSFAEAPLMNKNEDGTFSLQVPVHADTLAYQLIGLIPNEQSINGTQQDYMVYDGQGDYKSVIKTTDSTVTVTFDPQKLPRFYNRALPTALVKKGNAITQQILDAALMIHRTMMAWNEQRQRYAQLTGTDRGFRFNFSELDSVLNALEKTASSDKVKKYITFQRVLLTQYGMASPDTLLQYLGNNLTMTDPLWSFNPQIMPFVYERTMGVEKALAALEEALPQIESKNTRAFVLIHLGMRAKYMRNNEKVTWVYNQLKEGYEDIPIVKYYIAQFNPEMGISVGKQIPDFKVKNLDTGEEITKESLKGKFVLLDFWATWCAPCISEMPAMHQAYERFKDKNFVILSLSFDRKIEDLYKFRKGQWKMPWLHAYLDNSIRDQIAQKFEVSGIPKPILVSPEGVIVAMEADLRGQNLEKTLSKFIQ